MGCTAATAMICCKAAPAATHSMARQVPTRCGEADTDALFGGIGNDTLEAGLGIFGDVLHGEDGDDLLLGGDGLDLMWGGLGNDRLEGRALSDILNGGAGNDVIVGGAGRDFLNGDVGNDMLFGLFETNSPETTLPSDWQTVDDALFAREAAIRDDRKVVDQKIQDINTRIGELNAANEPIPAELQDELTRLLQRQADLANDRAIINLQQIDIDPVQTVQVDILVGGDDNDTLRGSNFNDKIFGDAGDDTIDYTPGNDLIFGGTHVLGDKFRVQGTQAADNIVVQLQPGVGITAPHVDIVVNSVALRVDHLEIEIASVEALGGDDTITVAFGNNAIMQVDADGGAGNDLIDASTLQDTGTFGGGIGNDTLLGGLSDDVLDGGNDNDILIGGKGFDTLLGGAGMTRSRAARARINSTAAQASIGSSIRRRQRHIHDGDQLPQIVRRHHSCCGHVRRRHRRRNRIDRQRRQRHDQHQPFRGQGHSPGRRRQRYAGGRRKRRHDRRRHRQRHHHRQRQRRHPHRRLGYGHARRSRQLQLHVD